MADYQQAKNVVRAFFEQIDQSTETEIYEVLKEFTAEDYRWRGVYPYREQIGISNVAQNFWTPLKLSLKKMQRRQDIFIAGENEIDGRQWVMSMGHFMGLFDNEWLGIRPTGKMINLRYAEFNCVVNDKIVETGLFLDLIGFMVQAGVNPLPPSTGNYFVYPGPRDHNGILFNKTDPAEGKKTADLVNQMVQDLTALNESGAMGCPPEILEKTWSSDMIWYGPGGIGASYTIPRYQQQHQLPFRSNLKDKKFNGHECRFAEGNFACFFGWPNLSNTPTGGFLGLPGGEVRADMQVVDVYYRKEDKLFENWVFIDIPYWLKQQGVDLLERTAMIANPK